LFFKAALSEAPLFRRKIGI